MRTQTFRKGNQPASRSSKSSVYPIPVGGGRRQEWFVHDFQLRANEFILYPASGGAQNSPPSRLMLMLGRIILEAMSLVNSRKD